LENSLLIVQDEVGDGEGLLRFIVQVAFAFKIGDGVLPNCLPEEAPVVVEF